MQQFPPDWAEKEGRKVEPHMRRGQLPSRPLGS